MVRYVAGKIVLVLLVVSGCVSTQERYERGRELEAQGRYAEAAAYYLRVLEEEPDWDEARERLQDVGERAITAYWDEAHADEHRAAYEDALQALQQLEDLSGEARAVGVTLPLPEGYAAYRDVLTERAYATLVQEAEQAEQAGDWPHALRSYERAERYATTADQRVDLKQAQARVHVRQAEYEMDREHYRAAYERIQHAVDLLSSNHPLAQRALDLQETALAAGTQYVAFLPLWSSDPDVLPESALRDLNDVLGYEYWSSPPLFLAPVDPIELRRELRRIRHDQVAITRRQAVEIGRVVEADYVVIGTWSGFERAEDDVSKRKRTARLRGRGPTLGGDAKDTTYVEQRYRVRLKAEATFRIVDPDTRRVVDEGTVIADASDHFEQGVFAGDVDDLVLSDSEARLFDEEERRLAERELLDDLIDELAERFAHRVYDRLLQRID